jgi:PAT family beta-lactamase induction signal transducer AmpG
MTDTSKISENITEPKRSWAEVFKSYMQPKMLGMLLLGLGSGLPFMMLASKLSRWLAEVGLEKSTIGFFFWIGLAYSFKFIWAPVVDRGKIPGLTALMGQRRSWMLFAIIGTVIGMSIISISNPAPGQLGLLLIGAFILAYSGATLDISVDAWRIESGSNDEQANLAAVYQLGYRFAIMLAGYAMVFADLTSWTGAYLGTALVMALIGCLVFFIKEPVAITRRKAVGFKDGLKANVVEPFLDLFTRLGKWLVPVFALIILYRLSDFTMGVMTQPLYEELGYTKTQVGLVQGTFGPWPMIVGTFIGGFMAIRLGLMRTLFYGAVIMIVTNAAYAWLALQADAVTWKLLVAIFCDNIALGIVGTGFIAYMSSIASREYAATQYALMTSAWSFFNKIIAGFSGILYDAVGSFLFFLITASFGIPAIILLLYIWRYGSALARGEAQPETLDDKL